MVKRYGALMLILILLSASNLSWATPPDFSGAVNNEYAYEEVVFLSGQPIKFVGTYSVSESEKDNQRTVTYKLNKLTPEDRSIDATLTRTITYVTNYTKWNDRGQTTAQTTIKGKPKETIKIGNDTYDLVDYQFSKSDIIDNRPAADYYSGNVKGRKYYTINRNQGTVTMEFSGGNVGYENFWGNTETQILDYSISYSRPGVNDEESIAWQGTVNIQTSDSQTKTLRYSDNDANYTSFHGGYVRTTHREMVSKYEYNLPRFNEEGLVANRRERGTIQLNLKRVPRLERLIVQKFRDIQGHWAEEDISKLYSLDVFDDDQSIFFAPSIPFTRLEFVKAVVKACNIRTSLENEKKTTARRSKVVEVSPFKDVSVDDSGYEFVKEAVNKKLISGVGNDLFQPNEPLTRAQAITILVRALGFEAKAPNPGYYTSFSDDVRIPAWAKDSIYIARELNLITGDDYNRVNPNKVVTRAEASSMLVRLLEFLEKDLQKDYRENIINFR